MLSVYTPAFASSFSRSPFGFGSFFDQDDDDFFGPLLLQPRVNNMSNKRPRPHQLQRRDPDPGNALSLFNSFLNNTDNRISDINNMQLDVIEKEDSYQVKADLPGMKKEDIKVSLDDKTNVLTLSATKSDEVNHDTDTYKRRERRFGSVSRSVRLPENSNLEGIDCEYQDGVLSLQVPKLAPIEEDTRHEEKHIKSIRIK